LGRAYGVLGVAVAYTGVMALYYVPVSTWIWATCRSEWQSRDDAGGKGVSQTASAEGRFEDQRDD
jgi:hypothetical protein